MQSCDLTGFVAQKLAFGIVSNQKQFSTEVYLIVNSL